MLKGNCFNCGRTIKKSNKYCNNKCQQEYEWKNAKQLIESGSLVKPRLLKRYLVENDNSCVECGLKEFWNNKSITLHMDHIDGNSDNNVLTNVRLLCPNCHSQTDTYGNAGLGKRYKKNTTRNNYLREYKGYGPDGTAIGLHPVID